MTKLIGCAEVDKNGQHAGLQDERVLNSGHAATLPKKRKRMIQSSKEHENESVLVSGSMDSFNSKKVKNMDYAPHNSCMQDDYTNAKNINYSFESSDDEKNAEAYRCIDNILMNDETDKESISCRVAKNLAHTSGGTTIQVHQSEMTFVGSSKSLIAPLKGTSQSANESDNVHPSSKNLAHTSGGSTTQVHQSEMTFVGSSKSLIAPLKGTSQSANESDNAHPSSSVSSYMDLESCRKKVGVGPSTIDVTDDDSLGMNESNNNDLSIDSYKGRYTLFLLCMKAIFWAQSQNFLIFCT